ncbi:MAG: thioredoxin domain-containing protein [Patescibacteria group bacterium]|nr:thioredoxin domain-containing protein [Patescibacteria group bacterium]
MLKKQNFPIVLFVTASLCVFVLMGIFYIFISSSKHYLIQPTSEKNERFYLNENYSNSGDSLITKKPSLKDVLAGPIITSSDPSFGKQDALITLVVFSDFECSFCHQQEKNLLKLIKEYKDKIQLIWKDYPENQEDSPSFQAALAGRCAQAQGKFWLFHDLAFAANNDSNNQEFFKIASQLDIDAEKFINCLENSLTKELVLDNITEANALGINGVPYIYINDRQVIGETSYEELKRMADEEIEKVK